MSAPYLSAIFAMVCFKKLIFFQTVGNGGVGVCVPAAGFGAVSAYFLSLKGHLTLFPHSLLAPLSLKCIIINNMRIYIKVVLSKSPS